MAEQAAIIEPQVERLVGPVARDTIGVITIRSRDERQPVKVPKDVELQIDEEAEARMLEKVNDVRLAAGLEALEVDERIRRVAREHSEEMFRLGYFAHDSPAKGTPFDRMSEAGIDYFVAGENIAYAQNVDLAHEGLMNSKSHRENILTPDYRKVGIGVIDAGIYGQMFTQDFTD
ncbi:MAG: CAP domain-containing protein [Candidatus Aquicultorales bacterium]